MPELLLLSPTVQQHIDGQSATPRNHHRREFLTIQALRALAAAMVVVYHANWGITAIDPRHNPRARAFQGFAGGVDIFFVISGFVMILSLSSRNSEGISAARQFATNRLQRIVPLYWVLTLVAFLLFKMTTNCNIDYYGPWHLVSSFLFIPAFDTPLIPAGWTLYLEMFFYLLISIALVLRVHIVRSVTVALLAFAVLHLFLHRWAVLINISKDVIVEFALGMFIARFVLNKSRALGSPWNLIAVGLGLITIASGGHGRYLPRCVYWGFPAFAIVGGAVCFEAANSLSLPRWLLRAGDASYSLYLAHPIVIWVLIGIVRHQGWHGPNTDVGFFLASLLLSAFAGILVFLFVEKPMTLWFKDRRTLASKRHQILAGSSA